MTNEELVASINKLYFDFVAVHTDDADKIHECAGLFTKALCIAVGTTVQRHIDPPGAIEVIFGMLVPAIVDAYNAEVMESNEQICNQMAKDAIDRARRGA